MRYLLILFSVLICVACNESEAQPEKNIDEASTPKKELYEEGGQVREENKSCFVSDKLRTQVGKTSFSFPRKDVYSVLAKEIKHFSIDRGIQGKEICQSQNDDNILVTRISLFIFPLPCSNEKDCNGKKIHVRLSQPINEKPDSYYPSKFRERCKERAEAWSEWEEKYGRICRMTFRDNGIDYWIQFYNGKYAYPPETFSKTKAMVIEKIDSMKITQP